MNQLELLQSIYDAVYIPAAVQDEFLAVSREHRLQSLAQSPWIQITQLQIPEYALAFPDLDLGEAEVLAQSSDLPAL